jgi:dTDP-glucose 4,6-dehydratase
LRILVTGASGFIGSAFVRTILAGDEHSVVAFVRNSDQRNIYRLSSDAKFQDAQINGRLRVIYGDLRDDISGLAEGCDAIVHFAAKTFVDRSIKDPLPFVEANVLGTYKILEEARRDKVKRFINISTDEVYGAILEGAYKEDARINPTNPYAATKAGADALAISYTHTFGLWTAVTRTENNYGPWQGREKVFPTFVRCLMQGKKLPVYGDGKHRRQWLWVDDHISAILLLLTADVEPGQVFHVAGSQELENLDLARRIISAYFGLTAGSKETYHIDCDKQIEFIEDRNVRPGHDRRYALVCEKMLKLGWSPKVNVAEGIPKAVKWYYENKWWTE